MIGLGARAAGRSVVTLAASRPSRASGVRRTAGVFSTTGSNLPSGEVFPNDGSLFEC